MAITPVVRISYAAIAEPKVQKDGKGNPTGAPKYGCQILIPKENTEMVAWFNNLIEAAIKKGIEKGLFNAKASKSVQFKHPMYDGDEKYEIALDEKKPSYETGRGHYVINCSNKLKPGTVDKYARPVDAAAFYSGCYCRLDISFYPFNNQSFGVGCGLNNLMFIKDGERFDGRSDATTAFAGVAETLDENGGFGGSEDMLD